MARDEANREAERRIEVVLRSGMRRLDLGEMKLTELPESLSTLTNLRMLNLSHNRLSVLPEWLGNFTQLQSLNLSHNKLSVLPEWMGNFTQLQSLNLSRNGLITLPERLGNFTRLRSLDLSRNGLTALPEWLGNLTLLYSLRLSSSGLTMLPEWLGNLTQLQALDLSGNGLTALPEWLGNLTQLKELGLFINKLTDLPKSVTKLSQLEILSIAANLFTTLPVCINALKNLKALYATHNAIQILPEAIGNLKELEILALGGKDLFHSKIGSYSSTYSKGSVFGNKLDTIPASLAQLTHLREINLDGNPLNPELAVAYKEGLDAVKAYLRAKAATQVVLNEAKLILIGEGEVGKSCLMDALQGAPWQVHDTTHGIEIKPVQVTDPDSGKEITLNGWDFGGQRVYRPTHQLFFSSPAVYLVVWKPREGPQQGFIKEWIKLVKHREPEAKILVVATHGGPGGRQPDIDRQEMRDLFGSDTVIDFFHVDSKPNKSGVRRGIKELKQAIARVASSLPEMGRIVPERWQKAREALKQTGAAYLPLERVLQLCRDHGMANYEANLFVTISHRLGHLIHYEHDPALRDIVVLKPDWLATAISFVLDDEMTRNNHGMVRFSRLKQLWNDPSRAEDSRYPDALHPIFRRLMERFDLSYRVAGLPVRDESDETSLIAQLVPDNRPDSIPAWAASATEGNVQQQQICKIVDAQNGQSATAEGLFYLLIVRLHKFSLGRVNYKESVHWQRGLVLDDDYNGRALLEHIGNDVRITVRAAYPAAFLAVLTNEVKYLVDSFWQGLRCDVMVPCLNPEPCIGLFEVRKLIENKKRNRPEQPCPICNEWQSIDTLLLNAPAALPVPAVEVVSNEKVLTELRGVRRQLATHYVRTMGRFDALDAGQRELLSKADAAYTSLMQALTDEAKEGPRLFSLVPVRRTAFNPRQWTSAMFRLTLWCEHSRLPLPSLNDKNSKKGVYDIELTRDWFRKAAPFLKFLTGTLSLILPVASSGIKLALDDKAYDAIEEQLDFGKEVIDASLTGSEKIGAWLGEGTSTDLEHGDMIRAQGAILREFQIMLKDRDPGFGGLVRVRNKRQEFMWVHERFEQEY